MNWTPPRLEDLSDRRLRYVRISLTDRCQFRCPYCRPEAGEEPCEPTADHLTARELARVVRVLTTIGIRTVRFTGGEPLLRRDLADVIASVLLRWSSRDSAEPEAVAARAVVEASDRAKKEAPATCSAPPPMLAAKC